MKRNVTRPPQPGSAQDAYDEAADPAGIGWLLDLLRAEKREAAAWTRVADVLRQARSEPLVAGSRRASFFAGALAEAAHKAAKGEDAWRFIESHLAAIRAEKRGSALREWVRAQWALHAAHYDRNKSSFAADYGTPDRLPDGASPRGLVWNEFKARVTARTIRERWLKDC